MPGNSRNISQELSLEDISSDLMGVVASYSTEPDCNALSLTSKTLRRRLLQNNSIFTANRRARALDYHFFSRGSKLPLQDPVTPPSITALNKVKLQFIPIVVAHSDESILSGRKKSLLFELLLNAEKAGLNTANVLMRKLPDTVREIITIQAIKSLPDAGEIKYQDVKIYLYIIIADRETKLPYEVFKKLLLSLERISDIPKKHKQMLFQAMVGYIRVFNNSLENIRYNMANDVDVINLFKKYNLNIKEITDEAFEKILPHIIGEDNARASALISEISSFFVTRPRRHIIRDLGNISAYVPTDKANAIADLLIIQLNPYDRLGVEGALAVRCAIEALVKISAYVSRGKAEVIVDALIPMLKASDSYVRSYVIYALEKIKAYVSADKAEVIDDALISRLKDSEISKLKASDSLVRFCAVQFLAEIGAYVSAAKAEVIVDALIPMLKDSCGGVKNQAAKALAEIMAYVSADKAEVIVDALIPMLKDSSCDYINTISIAFAKIVAYVSADKAQEIVDTLISMLKDSNGHFKTTAASALAKMVVYVSAAQVEEMVDPLISMLKDSSCDYINTIFIAFAKIVAYVSADKAQEIVDALISMLKDSNGYVKTNAAIALAKMAAYVSAAQAEEVVDPLICTLKNSNGYVKKSAARALGNIAAYVSADKAEEIVGALISMLKDFNRDVRCIVATALWDMAVHLSEKNAKQLIEEINNLYYREREVIIFALCRYFTNPAISADTIPLNDSLSFIQGCLLNGINFLYVLHYLLTDKAAVTEAITQFKPEIYDSFLTKVFKEYQHKIGRSAEINKLLQDKHVTPQQKMETVVKCIWKEKNKDVFFGNAIHSSLYSVVQGVVQEMGKTAVSRVPR